MRTADERPVAQGGDGPGARALLAAHRGGFIEQHALWGEEQYAAAAQLRRVIDELGIERVRVAFADQHGLLRSKTLSRDGLAGALRDGIRAPSSLLLKDTSGRSAFPVFSADMGLGVGGLTGAGDVVLVPDPVTFRPLPWSPGGAVLLSDLCFPNGERVPFCTRSILCRVLEDLRARGYGLTVGIELEFHVFRGGEPGALTTRGTQLLHDDGLDELDGLVAALHDGLTRLDLPLCSIEREFGPSQLEVTLGARDALAAADEAILCRAAIRQICRRAGYHATFMSRPAGAQSASTGWHLHQSLRDLNSGHSVFAPPVGDAASGPGYGILSADGGSYLAGLLAHAPGAAVFTTPTVNGYKRYQPESLAPDRVVWGIDNRGAMVRVIRGAGGSGARLENRSGEPAANPYLFVASQVLCGLDGVDCHLDPGPPTEEPYAVGAPRLPRSLGEALDALAGDSLLRAGFSEPVVGWYSALKRAEFERYLAHVSDWEQREYFTLL
ncbi:MAG: glutamine synthetase family protein [Solirubrobacteraceae bacterium]